jgi:hypothetical protein
MDRPSESDRRDIQEQLACTREELASMREELNVIREAMGRAIREMMVTSATQDGPSPN